MTATGWKMKRRPNSAYLTIFLTSAASETDPAASAAGIRFEDDEDDEYGNQGGDS